MHFVSGGAYNGKANWVKSYYQLNEKQTASYEWLSAYEGKSLMKDWEAESRKLIVLEGIEQWTLQMCKKNTTNGIYHELEMSLNRWLKWTKQEGNKLVIIGTDISKGIVPVDGTLRKWRDMTGFIYQEIVEMCSTFHYIWYGIAQQLKK